MRTLRADLAAAARDARTDPPSSRDDPRTASRLQLHRAEALLAEFRAQLRADLRSEVARGELTADTVELLRSRLDDVRQEVRAALRR
jgi:hypothetical protein